MFAQYRVVAEVFRAPRLSGCPFPQTTQDHRHPSTFYKFPLLIEYRVSHLSRQEITLNPKYNHQIMSHTISSSKQFCLKKGSLLKNREIMMQM